MMQMNKVYVPDISTIINGRVTQLVEDGDLEGCEIALPKTIFAELEHRAGLGKDSGFSGLAELRQLKEFSEEGIIQFSFVGKSPQIEQTTSDERRSMIRDVAREHGATLITSDEVMAETAEVEDIEVRHLKPLHEEFKPKLFSFLSPKPCLSILKKMSNQWLKSVVLAISESKF